MTVSELIEALSHVPGDVECYLQDGPFTLVTVEKISFSPGGKMQPPGNYPPVELAPFVCIHRGEK